MSAAVIGALRVNLGIDSAQFQNGLKSAQTGAERFAARLKTAMLAAAAAAGAALAGIAASVKSTIDTMDDMSKAASKIGIPIEELSKLAYAADLSGVSMQGLQTAVGRLSRNMADAASGTGEGAKAFAKLGISVKGADGNFKSSSTILAEIADRFKALPDGAQKTALAMQLMGRSGAEMIPLLNGGSGALNELLMEAARFGLVISGETGRAAEAFNDNLSRMGYAVKGVGISLAAALLPVLVPISEGFVRLSQAIVGALDYLPTLAEYAAVAGGSLALMLAPTLVAAAGNLAVAIGAGLVGAVRLLTAAMLANPLGAFAVAVASAVTAAYYFRDEIQKAIGVDVVAIAKSAGNLVIGSFVAAYHDIVFVWKNFGNIMGAAVVGGVNAAIRALNGLLSAAASGIDWLIEKLNTIPGVEIGKVGGGLQLSEIQNSYAEALTGGGRHSAISRHLEKQQGALTRDYLGALGAAFEGATPAAMNFGTAIEGVNDQLDELGGGGKKGKGDKGKKVKETVDKVAQAVENAKETLGQGFGSIIDGLVKGTMSWKDAIISAGQALLKYLNSVNIAEGGKGLFGGGFLQGLFGSLLGFANGGSFKVGGAGGIDSQLVAFKASPNERVSITKPGQDNGGSGQALTINQAFTFSGAATSNELKQYAQQMGVHAVETVKNSLPDWQMKLGRDGAFA